MSGETFVDWITVTERHPGGGLPIIVGGVVVHADAAGNVRFERVKPSAVCGSFSTSLRVGCDGSRVFLSGNVGRFARPDNVFNLGWAGTIAACDRVLEGLGLPRLGSSVTFSGHEPGLGARLRRVDLTANFGAGSDAQARAVIRWIGSRAVARVKRGAAGDSSVWFGNTRRFFKAYVKADELLSHGMASDELPVAWCRDRGVVRVEVELKRRLLDELGLAAVHEVTQERLDEVFREQTEILRRVDHSDDPDLIAAVPSRSRAILAAWLAGVDVRTLVSRATLFRHAAVLRDFGVDVLEPRNVVQARLKVRIVDLEPLAVPEWHWSYPLRRVG